MISKLKKKKKQKMIKMIIDKNQMRVRYINYYSKMIKNNMNSIFKILKKILINQQILI